MLIRGERVGLAALEPSAAPLVHAWSHEPELRRLAFTEFMFPQWREAAETWIRETARNPRARLLAIHRLDDQAIIGMMTVRKISWVSQSARFGIMLWPPDQQGKGMGTEARRIFLEYAFRQMGFRRIYGDFESSNTASRKSHEKLGAVVSVRAREAAYLDGQYRDLCHYTYLCERFVTNPGLPKGAGAAADHARLAQDLERAWLDFCQLPDATEGPAGRDEWLARHPRCVCGDSAVVLQPEWPRRNATLYFFRRTDGIWQPAPVETDLLSSAVRKAFDELNVHRVQVFLPSTALGPGDQLRSLGFDHEGSLDSILFSAGRHVDLAVFGRVRDA